MIKFQTTRDGQLDRTFTCKLHGSVAMTWVTVYQDHGAAEKLIESKGPYCPICIVHSMVANVPRSYIDED